VGDTKPAPFQVAVLLLYHTSMSCRSPGDWNEFDYKTQVIPSGAALQQVPPNLSWSVGLFPPRCRTLHLPWLKCSPGGMVPCPWLGITGLRGVSLHSMFSGPPSSPMGDVMQTPQFQLRRLKKQLAVERENRDELEVELAENRKLLTEKDAQISLMQQRIDRLALLNEKQAADQQEPKEMEELREKNESLMVRLHEALKQCQDLKTEKGQMNRKINQLSEENGDLSFKLREIASHLVQLQEALNELSEEHNAALAQSQEKQGQLESELRGALQDKKCSEEKLEILQGKISLLEDQLAKLGDGSAQQKGEVLGDVLKLEELKQEVSNLAAQGAELQATVLRLEEEKQQREAALQSERGRFQEEKQQLGSLVANLQSSLSESQRAREMLEQNLQGREAEAERSLRERDSALQQLQHLREANATLSSQLQATAQARDAGQAASAEEKAELSRKIGELEAKILELGEQGTAEGLKAQLRELEGRLKESQQRLAEREKLARENSRLQERLLFLEESLRNTEGILEDEKRRAAESLEGSLARIAELEAERQQPVPPDGDRGRLEEEMQALSREHGHVCQRLQAEQEKVATLEAQAKRLASEQQERLAALQADLSGARARVKEKEGEEQKLRAEVSSLREKVAITEQTAAQRAAGLEADARRAAEALEGLSQQLSQEKAKSKELEGAVERLRSAEAELSQVATAGRQRELELEAEVKKLSEEVTLLGTRLEETRREHRRELAGREEEAERLRQEVERGKGDCAAERARKAELEAQLQNSLNEQRVERSAQREELARSRELVEEKEGELEELRQKNLSQGEELRELQKTVSKLKGELASAKESPPEVDNELQGRDAEGHGVKSSEKTQHGEQEPGSTELEASRREAAQQKEKVSELQKMLEASRSAQALQDGAVETLRKELQEKGRELTQSKTSMAAAEKELASLRSVLQEKGRSEENWKDQVSQCVQEMERKNSLIGSLEHEVSILHRQVTEKEGESKELKRLIVAESEKSKKLEERLRVLQTEMATAASRAAERCSLMKVEVQRCQEEMEKQRLAVEALKRDRHCQSEREEELRQEVKVCQDKCHQKEQLLAALQQELGGAQALAGELPALKHLCQQLQAERASLENQHRQEMEQRGKTLAALQAELARAKLEASEALSLRERSAEQDRAVQRLQAEAAETAARLAGLQQANARLAEENRGLGESRSRGQQRLEAELGQARERHVRELERLRSASEELVAGSRREAEEAARKLEAMSQEYESSKAAAREERRKLLEERQKLTAQVWGCRFRVPLTLSFPCPQALEGELQAEATRQQEKVAELQAQLAQKEQVAEHYKGQMEKAKTHYDAKKQQNQELAEKLKAMEQLQKENGELRKESERLAKELQQSVLQAKEAELSCRNLTSQVHSLEAQVGTAGLRPSSSSSSSFSSSALLWLAMGLAKWGGSTESPPHGGGRGGGGDSVPLPRSGETPQQVLPPALGPPPSEGHGASLPTQTLPIIPPSPPFFPHSQKQAKTEEPTSADGSFYTIPAESLHKLETSSPQDTPTTNSTLLGLPGYRPVTRSSLRLGQGGSSSSLGRSSIYLGTCQDEPEQLDDWNRIAELQQRNRACPPHLKTCYPLESRPSNALGTITDEEMKTGDPKETLRRASVQPSQLAPGVATRRTTLAGAIGTRQLRKRRSDESHQGPDTPESHQGPDTPKVTPPGPPTTSPRSPTRTLTPPGV
uniref:Nuclear mitotic apparatus protein 1 n=1 Tax=Calidris pygmaea TaxID=425635 RepID=A0A8C3PPS3_9CHAR